MLSVLRFAFRHLAKAPGYSATVIATFALAIGACTAIYSVVDAVLLRPLPYPNGERIHHLGYTAPTMPSAWASSFDLYVWKEELSAYELLAASIKTDLNRATEVEPRRVQGFGAVLPHGLFGGKNAIAHNPVNGVARQTEGETPVISHS